MPKTPAVPHKKILEALLSTSDYFSNEGAIHPPTHPAWTVVASKLENRSKPKYIWVMVWENRHSFQDKIREHFNLNNKVSEKSLQSNFSPSTENDSLSSNESEFSIASDSKIQCVQPKKDFIVIISPEIWEETQSFRT